jgi:methyltransferase (TIGR00027 family)
MKPISDTAFYCCGIRMQDASSKRPICNDTFAATFMDRRGLDIYARFGGVKAPNASNVARHRYIDDYLRETIAAQPQLRIVIIGCGFDSRAYRLAGGEWYELDEPQIIAYKNERLAPTSCPNKLHRIAIDFAADSLADILTPLAADLNRPTVFVIEGVTMYLPEGALDKTLAVLTALFPSHEVIADLMTRQFIDTFGRNIKAIIAQLGADMIPAEDPAVPFAKAGYREVSRQSIIELTFIYRKLGLIKYLLRRAIPAGLSGYTVRVYRSPE